MKHDFNKQIDEVMTKENLITAREGIHLVEAQAILKKHKIEKLPIVDEEGTFKRINNYKRYRKENSISLMLQKILREDYFVEQQLELSQI